MTVAELAESLSSGGVMTRRDIERLYDKLGYEMVTREPIVSCALTCGMNQGLSSEDALILMVQTLVKVNAAQQAALIAERRLRQIFISKEP
jgi:hypothetical protein